jgi:Cu-Zn family superoxide dismutase
MAVAVIHTEQVQGTIVAKPYRRGVQLTAHLTKLPKGKHGFHIHKAGDLRGEGCHGLCEHFDKGRHAHGDGPHSKRERHTGDLGNIEILPGKKECVKRYYLPHVTPQELWGRSIIIHEGEDDLGLGTAEDSQTTGHSGARMACAIFGRMACPPKYNRTRKQVKK